MACGRVGCQPRSPVAVGGSEAQSSFSKQSRGSSQVSSKNTVGNYKAGSV
jgi:hypothetical protein